MKGKPLILGHRGASHDAPENTCAAFSMAMEQQADGVELDVQLTTDGRLCVIHDHTLERTTSGFGPVGEKTMAELSALSAGAWFSPEFSEQKVPELADVLALLPEGATVNVEIKNGPAWYEGIGTAVAEQLCMWKNKLSLIVSSFDHQVLEEVHRREPALYLGLLYEARLYDPVAYVRSLPYPVYSLHLWHGLITAEIARQAHAAGLRVFAYTVDESEDVARLTAFGIDAIMTNKPREVRQMSGHRVSPRI
ncbi:glycerophosphodiester phosphodiesterase [Brevibacillus borstelensis]|uniref:glycerophosphodiester phosphodiesterase n=1 Tax=Brevibacillus borstelensis TaxID=45462 RepID=UPI0004691D5F|nr:glycerophosphodiester phosphodiesterase family protein [Brevibacillus borstelensis]